MKSFLASLTFVTAATLVVGCGKSADSFSLLADGSSYKQNATYVPRKVDVLWVIDNSGSMASSQTALATNFQSFINKFIQTDSDFQMAVTTTDAYLARYSQRNGAGQTTMPYTTYSRIRDGAGSNHSGVFVMKKDTANLSSVFNTNIKQGTSGSGDERAFQSMEYTLADSWNSSFRRPGAYLAVIIVSDEDDFSHNDLASIDDTYRMSEDYNDPTMYTTQHYIDYLTTFTASSGSAKNYSVNAISIFDDACLAQIGGNAQKKATRYGALVDATGGSKISICSDFSQSLTVLSQSIIDLSSSFPLTRIPNEATIVVTVNGVSVAKGALNGWTYDAASNSIIFHGDAVPAAGAAVNINFDPAGVKN